LNQNYNPQGNFEQERWEPPGFMATWDCDISNALRFRWN